MNIVSIPVRGRVDLMTDLVQRLLRSYGEMVIAIWDNNDIVTEQDEREAMMSLAASHHSIFRFEAADQSLHEMWNRGLDLAHPGDNVLTLNSDVGEFDPDLVPKLSETLRSSDDIGVVCPRYDNRDGHGLIDVEGCCGNRYDGSGGLAGFAFMMRGEAAYRFPEEMRWWYGDNHMIQCIRKIGGRAVMDLDVRLHHVALGGNTTSGDWKSKAEEIEKDRQWWVQWKKGRA